jgi:hypothetical protein
MWSTHFGTAFGWSECCDFEACIMCVQACDIFDSADDCNGLWRQTLSLSQYQELGRYLNVQLAGKIITLILQYQRDYEKFAKNLNLYWLHMLLCVLKGSL